MSFFVNVLQTMVRAYFGRKRDDYQVYGGKVQDLLGWAHCGHATESGVCLVPSDSRGSVEFSLRTLYRKLRL